MATSASPLRPRPTDQVKQPIINSPYHPPEYHWDLDYSAKAINNVLDGRRVSQNSPPTVRAGADMTTIPRPNKDALIKVVDIYRDAMRPFLIHHLRQVPGRRVEDAIRQALRDNQINQFDQNLRSGRTVTESIDINDFPELVRAYWREVFSNRFPGDRVIQNRLYEIKTIRDEASHPGASDLDEEKTRAHIYMVADVLGKIGKDDEKRGS